MTAAPGPLTRRTVTVDEVDRLAARYSTWGEWGADDERGAANRVTPQTVLAAVRTVTRGAVFSLALPLDRTGPMLGTNGRVNPQHVMLRTGSEIVAGPGEPPAFAATDGAIYLPLSASTQWDGFSHIMYHGRSYNDRSAGIVTSQGAEHNSVTNLVGRSVGRGVLLDIPRMLGRDWLEPGEAIHAEHLEACADWAGLEIGEGDFVVVRTGQMAQRRAAGSWGDYAGGPAPGLAVSTAEFLCERRVVAVATDTWGIEVLPYETEELRAPLHVILLVHAGIYIGEMWDLEELAADCAEDGRWEFLLSAPPMTITGAVASPLHPIAIK